MLDVGDTAPEFELEDHERKPVSLTGFLSRGPLLLFFYPNDFGLVCTREACAFREGYQDLEKNGTNVAGISPQPPESHRQFRDSLSLPFPLLSDPEKEVIGAFGVKGPLGLTVRRATFLIGPDRRILRRAVADLFLGEHRKLIREAGQVTGA